MFSWINFSISALRFSFIFGPLISLSGLLTDLHDGWEYSRDKLVSSSSVNLCASTLFELFHYRGGIHVLKKASLLPWSWSDTPLFLSCQIHHCHQAEGMLPSAVFTDYLSSLSVDNLQFCTVIGQCWVHIRQVSTGTTNQLLALVTVTLTVIVIVIVKSVADLRVFACMYIL